tara:strand:- start:2385 stop:3116 length:732 start_codon:yes stop_codon:yes gene_type:complete
MTLLHKKPIEHTNLIKEWYDKSVKSESLKKSNIKKYERGMFISITNRDWHYEDIHPLFRRQYVSIVKALKGKDYDFTKWNVRKLKGDFVRDKIALPSKEVLLKLCAQEIPIMLCGVHNYRLDDIKSKGKGYCHSHFYLYNIHQHLPSNPIELARVENQIENNLLRYSNIKNTRQKIQGVVRIKEVGIGAYQFTDAVTPLKLYDYLKSPDTHTQEKNIINYIASNRHNPELQYPLFTIYSNKRL